MRERARAGGSVAAWLAGVWDDLAELVLPGVCVGCDEGGVRLAYGVCARCAAGLESLAPARVQPDPAPAGLPPTTALGEYGGVLRDVLLSYKERGRHGLAAPLGGLLAEVIDAAAPDLRGPLLLISVPSTAQAARSRHGDHLARLTRHAATRLRQAGRPATVARPLRAVARPDSAGLSRQARAAAVAGAFRSRPERLAAVRRTAGRAAVIVLDDVITTGATLAAVTRHLAGSGVPVAAAAVLAATRRQHAVTRLGGGSPTRRDA